MHEKERSSFSFVLQIFSDDGNMLDQVFKDKVQATLTLRLSSRIRRKFHEGIRRKFPEEIRHIHRFRT
jgi:hypothetical protein